MEATYTIKGDAARGQLLDGRVERVQLRVRPHQPPAGPADDPPFAFNRRTGQLVDCCGANVNGDTSVRQTGLVGYVFPIGTQKQTYQVFDTTLKKTVPFVYSGTANVDGIQAYEFMENVPPTQIATQTLPGSFVGIQRGDRSRCPSIDQVHLIYYVDPETGALIDVNEDQTTSLRNPRHRRRRPWCSSTPT